MSTLCLVVLMGFSVAARSQEIQLGAGGGKEWGKGSEGKFKTTDDPFQSVGGYLAFYWPVYAFDVGISVAANLAGVDYTDGEALWTYPIEARGRYTYEILDLDPIKLIPFCSLGVGLGMGRMEYGGADWNYGPSFSADLGMTLRIGSIFGLWVAAVVQFVWLDVGEPDPLWVQEIDLHGRLGVSAAF